MQTTRLFCGDVELANTSSGGDHFVPSVGDEVIVIFETYKVVRRLVTYSPNNITIKIFLERT